MSFFHRHVLWCIATITFCTASQQVRCEPVTLDAGFWFGNFDVGEAKNLSLIIDTASFDVAVNPGCYIPTAQSVNLHQTGKLGYSTTETNGCGSAEIKYDVYTDVVSVQGLVAHNQTFAAAIRSTPPNNSTITKFPHDGIVGFSGVTGAGTQLGGVPFFQSLCSQRMVKECRFGLAFGTAGTGQQILGGLASDLFEGELSPLREGNGMSTLVAAKSGSAKPVLVEGNSTVVLDSGTANIVGTKPQVRRLFEALGLEIVEQKSPGCGSVVYGYYPCDSAPDVGFRFGGSDSPVFNIEPSAFALANDGRNNCTAVITGETDFEESVWLLGQAWFQGKYVDFRNGGKSIESGRGLGVATLINKSFGGSI